MAPSLLLLAAALTASALAQDERVVEVFPGGCASGDAEVLPWVQAHPSGADAVAERITAALSLRRTLPCDTQVYRYVYFWVPVGGVEMNATSSLESAQSAAGPELQDMGLPVDCPVPPGEYLALWAPPAEAVVGAWSAHGRFIMGVHLRERATGAELLRCEFHLHLARSRDGPQPPDWWRRPKTTTTTTATTRTAR